jgi:hypothetical protein
VRAADKPPVLTDRRDRTARTACCSARSGRLAVSVRRWARPAPQQAAQAPIGTEVQNSMTGQDLHQTVKAMTPDGPFTTAPGDGKRFRCDITLSSGKTLTAEATVWSDGSIGWHEVS